MTSGGESLSRRGVSLSGGGVSVQGWGTFPGGLCPEGGSLSRGESLSRRGVSLSGGGVSVQGRGLCLNRDSPRTVTSGRYASYWNEFLSFSPFICIALQCI